MLIGELRRLGAALYALVMQVPRPMRARSRWSRL